MGNDPLLYLLPERLLPWFRENARDLPWRRDREPYHVWLSEIMLQQTRVEAVRSYYARFLAEIPDIPALAAADPDRLRKLWEGLGYYSRVRNLQQAAKVIVERYGGAFPMTLPEIRALPGIGDYTAGAIASICFGLPEPAVDGNVLRVVLRMTGDPSDASLQKTKDAVRAALRSVYPPDCPGNFTQSLMELGATVCVPNGAPSCGTCPLGDVCRSRGGLWRELPVKTPKKARRGETYTVFLLRCGDHTALRRRDAEGLLASLWELPNLPGLLSPEAALSAASAFGVRPFELTEERERMHIFTHVEWKMRCFTILCREMPDCFFWADRKMLEGEMALPTAFRLFL